MRDAGYTLVETLAALMMVGLATTGLFAGLSLLGKLQLNAVGDLDDARNRRAAQASLEQLLLGRGPFRRSEPAAFIGDATALRFQCEAEECAAKVADGGDALIVKQGSVERRISFKAGAKLAFSYLSGHTATSSWPTGTISRDRLSGVVLKSAQDETLNILVRLWPEHASNCEFDTVFRDCR